MSSRKVIYKTTAEALEALYALPSDVDESDDDNEGFSDGEEAFNDDCEDMDFKAASDDDEDDDDVFIA